MAAVRIRGGCSFQVVDKPARGLNLIDADGRRVVLSAFHHLPFAPLNLVPRGWIKTVVGMPKTKLRGLDKRDWAFAFTAAACNLVRLPKLLAVSP